MSKNKRFTILTAIAAAVVIVCIVVADFFLSMQIIEKTDYAMGAVVTQNIKGKNASETASEIINEIKETESAISWRIDDSQIAKLNENKSCEMSEKIINIFSQTIEFCKKSGGVVDPTVGALTRLWNIGTEEFRLPEEAEIKNALKNVSYSDVKIKNNTVSIGEKQFVDLGFIGKGVACDEAKNILLKNKIKEAIINVGGNLYLHGEGTYTVGIRNPLGEVSDYIAVLNVEESFLATSGNYERLSESDGKKYHHILSTETGYPVENDLLSVTVVCDSGMLSDALSTAVYCLGYDGGIKLLEEYDAEAVFIFNDKSIKITDGLKGKFELKDNEFKLWKEN